MDDCIRREAQISALLDGELPENEREELLEHIAQCERCSAVYAAFASVSEAVSEGPEVPPELHERIMTAVKDEKRPAKKTRSPFVSILTAAACVTLVIAVGSHLGNGGENFGSDEAPPTYAAEDGRSDMYTERVETAERTNTFSAVVSLSADELSLLLAPAGDMRYDGNNKNDVNDNTCIDVYEIYTDFGGESKFVCTVTVAGECVYADFGGGAYLTECTPDELSAIIPESP